MRRLLVLALVFPLVAVTSFVVTTTSCSLLGIGSDAPVDLSRVADQVALYRQDVTFLAPLASPELQAKLLELDATMAQVETALRAGAVGGPIDDVLSGAKAALALASAVAAELPEENDLRFAIALAQILLAHVASGEFAQAMTAS